MSCQSYRSSLKQMDQDYISYPDSLGLMAGSSSYELTPQLPYNNTLTASQNAQQYVLLQNNPSSALYRTYGPDSLELQASGSKDCETGCLGAKSNPSNPIVKPYYQHNYYQMPQVLQSARDSNRKVNYSIF